jgi:His-Xaa-Ser repeat protein HxsA
MGETIMNRKSFLIPSLLAAGFSSPHDVALASLNARTPTGDDPNAGNLFRLFQQDHEVQLAGHSSHRSHSSHSSHRSSYGGGHYSHTSHRSSYGGSYDPTPVYVPSPSYSSPAPSPAPAPYSPPASERATAPLFSPPPRANDEASLPALSGRSQRFIAIVRRVQIALLAQGFYTGKIDGIVGPALRGALRKFQSSRSLEATGTITPQTLDALMISSS